MDNCALLLGAVIALLIGYLLGWCFNESYVGGGPSYRNWTSGATQRHATSFSGTNQGYPGNMAQSVHNPTYDEAQNRAKFGSDESLVGTRQDPNFVNPLWSADYKSKADNAELALQQALLNNDNVSLHDIVNSENALLGAKLL